MSNTNEDGGEDAPHCWICHEEGTDESEEPLRRDCSCRGSDSGFAHLSCLIENAKHRTKQWDGRDFDKLWKLWQECPGCKQRYQNELRVELATEFVSFVETNYSDNQRIYVTALYEKLLSLTNIVNLNNSARQEAKQSANKILSLVEQMKAKQDPLLNKVQLIEPKVYNCLGRIALKEATKDSFKEALSHFEKNRDLSILLGLSIEVAVAECNIIIAKELCGEIISIEKKVDLSQKLYDMRLKLNGEGALNTLDIGTILARDLMKADRLAEAESLLLKLATVSKRVHGSDHDMTKTIDLLQIGLRERQNTQRLCSVCNVKKSSEYFSKNQRGKSDATVKCKDCLYPVKKVNKASSAQRITQRLPAQRNELLTLGL